MNKKLDNNYRKLLSFSTTISEEDSNVIKRQYSFTI